MPYETFMEKQQGILPGPLDAEFHLVQLWFGGDRGMVPQRIIDVSQELNSSCESLISAGIYADIPPKLADTIEESDHTIEVAVRRSFDFMKLPVIIGGTEDILPSVFRGLDGQLSQYDIVSIENLVKETSNTVITLNCDLIPAVDYNEISKLTTIDSVKAIVCTGSSEVDYQLVADTIANLLNAIAS